MQTLHTEENIEIDELKSITVNTIKENSNYFPIIQNNSKFKILLRHDGYGGLID